MKTYQYNQLAGIIMVAPHAPWIVSVILGTICVCVGLYEQYKESQNEKS